MLKGRAPEDLPLPSQRLEVEVLREESRELCERCVVDCSDRLVPCSTGASPSTTLEIFSLLVSTIKAGVWNSLFHQAELAYVPMDS